jgi:hypothetical protein
MARHRGTPPGYRAAVISKLAAVSGVIPCPTSHLARNAEDHSHAGVPVHAPGVALRYLGVDW